MELAVGMIVEVSGLAGEVKPVEALEGVIAPMSLNGHKAQLIEFDKSSQKWIAGTFGGALIGVSEKNLTPVSCEDMDGVDLIMGPISDPEVVGEQLGDALAEKGFSVVKVVVSEADTVAMLQAAKTLEDDDQFGRLPVEFEPGYLGQGGFEKVLNIDTTAAGTPSIVADSPLETMDNNFSAISSMLAPTANYKLGFDVWSRTSLMLRMPISEDEVERYAPGDIEEAEVESYLHLMYRRQLTGLQFVGPETGTLKLIPKRQGAEAHVLKAEPSSMVFINMNLYDYSYLPSGGSLALQTFYLQAPVVWDVGEIEGDVSTMTMTRSGPPAPKEPHITVISMFCRYGGGVNGRHAYWAAAGKAATDGATEVPILRWDNNIYYDPDSVAGGTYTKHGTFGIDGVDLFDNKFFDISPSEARGMAPTQRQVMEVSYVCLAGAGFIKKDLQRKSENICHFVGIDKDDWTVMPQDSGGAGSAADAITANRFSFSLNLKGASMQIDTACSSSLVCTHVSKLHLRMQDNDPIPATIVNGLNIMIHPGPYIGCCGSNMLSHEGRCFTFNATADGYERGELCGAIAFKVKDFDDDTFNVLAGTQANQDGRSASLTAPNGPAQERCLQAVLRESKASPSEIDIFECHGTGTSLGDPIEIGSFRKVMSSGVTREDPLYIASSKSNICHGEGGAGLAGFFKCCMQTQHCESSPNLHLRNLNPHLDLDGFPCQPLTETNTTREMAAFCGVSSFGFGGTNAHAEAWAPQIATTRGGFSEKDPLKMFHQKILVAPPAEITVTGEAFEEWETSGIAPGATAGDEYTITVAPDGVVEWEKFEAEVPDSYGEEFFLQGSFNDWSATETIMEQDSSIPGLWKGSFTLGSSGVENFQIIGDSDPDIVYAPGTENCTSKASPIKGPDAFGPDKAWMARGKSGDIVEVEFFIQDATKSISWFVEDSTSLNAEYEGEE